MRRRLIVLAAALALAAPLSAQAHRQWILPSATVLSGDDPWVTLDAAVSNELFYADHNPMRLDNVTVTAPDGTVSKPQNPSTGKYRSVFDVQLTQNGTYRIANAGAGLSARYKLNGEDKVWRAPPGVTAPDIPAGATDVQITQNQSRTETFVTRGAPTPLKPVGSGLELAPVTHPNDLVAGEAATFKLLLDGQPAAGVEVTMLPGAARYRNNPGEVKVKTGPDGAFTVTAPEPGLYWLNATVRDQKATVANAARSASYNVVLEVLQP